MAEYTKHMCEELLTEYRKDVEIRIVDFCEVVDIPTLEEKE